MFEPEVTKADDELFAGLSAASETAAHEEPAAEQVAEPSFGLSLDDEITANKPEVHEEAPVEAPAVETAQEEPVAEPTVDDLLAKYVPQYFAGEADKAGEEPAAEPAPVTEPEPAAEETPSTGLSAEETLFGAFAPEEKKDDSPIVGFAPAVTEAPEVEIAETEPVAPAAPVIRLDDFGTEPAEPAKPAEEVPAAAAPEEPKTSDAVSLDDLEKDLFGAQAGEGGEAETTKKIDKFYTLYRKNEEFQRLLDEEYSRLKGEHIEVPEDDTAGASLGASAAAVVEAAQGSAEESVPDAEVKAPADFSATAILEELGESKTPVEDATIYRDMPEELKETGGFSVEGTENKSFGLDASDAATVAAGAAAAGVAMTKAEKKAAKKAEKKARKEAAAAAQVEYEDVDSGSTVLTILAVIVAVLLVVLLAIILILHIAPGSELAMTIDEFIENITSRFSAVNTFGGHWLL